MLIIEVTANASWNKTSTLISHNITILYRSCVFGQQVLVTGFFFRTDLGNKLLRSVQSQVTGNCPNFLQLWRTLLHGKHVLS